MHEHGRHQSGPATEPVEHRGGGNWIVLAGFAAIAGFYLWTEHRAHLLGVLPWLILLACPLLHLFMHRGGHGHGGGRDGA